MYGSLMISDLVWMIYSLLFTVKCVRDKTGYFAERLYTSMKVNTYVSMESGEGIKVGHVGGGEC